jgi:hypothetical protein
MEVELTKARAEAAEAKRQLELQRAAQRKAEPKARTQAKAPDEPGPMQPASIAHAPVKVEPAAAKPSAAPEQKGFLPRWLWSSSPQKNT